MNFITTCLNVIKITNNNSAGVLMGGYTTVAKRSRAEITEKRSRFIATVTPVRTEDEAIAFLNEIKKEYTDARHNVYAYCLRENNTARYSDDGEPSQTAGLPIMDLIKKLGITDVAVVVTRYFGGILLGTGGLVHAYTKAAKEGIIASEPVKMILCRELLIRCDYTFLGKIQSLLSEKGFLFSDPEYSDKVTIKAFVPEENAESFKSYIIDLCSGRADLTFKDTKYQPICTKIL